MNFSLQHVGRVPPAMMCRFMRPPADKLNSRVAGPKPLVERLKRSTKEIVLHPRIGSLALRLCRVAQGSLDAAFAGGQSRDWDLAAANLIVEEANGSMTALSGDALLYNRREVAHGVLVAAGRERHAHIIEYFRKQPLP